MSTEFSVYYFNEPHANLDLIDTVGDADLKSLPIKGQVLPRNEFSQIPTLNLLLLIEVQEVNAQTSLLLP